MRASLPLGRRQQRPRRGPHQMVGVRGQRQLAGCPLAAASPGTVRRSAVDADRRVDVHPRQIRGPVTEHGVELVGGRCGAPSGQVDSSQPCAQMGPSGWRRA